MIFFVVENYEKGGAGKKKIKKKSLNNYEI